MFVLFFVELAAAGAAVCIGRPRYLSWVREHPALFGEGVFAWLCPAALWTMDRCRLAERFSASVGRIHQLMIGLHGSKHALTYTKWFIARLLLMIYGALCFSTLLSGAAGGNGEMLLYGGLMIILLPFLLYKQTADRLKRKKRDMLIELPELVNQLMLLVGAGETVQQALIRTVYAKASTPSPLLNELNVAVYALKMNASFPRVMEDFSKRCGLQEASLFTTTLLLNYKRGGDELIMSLKELSMTLWDKRKALARTLGEEASSKMVFPMVLIFFVVMVMVAAPALLMMN